MLRDVFLVFLVFLTASLSFALPTGSEVTTLARRDSSVNHAYPRAADPCTTGTAYRIQSVGTGFFGKIRPDFLFAPAKRITFDSRNTEKRATKFTFVRDSNGVCRLAVAKTRKVPDGLTFLSTAVDDEGNFNDPHNFRLVGSTQPDPDQYDTYPIQCVNNNLRLSCTVINPEVSETQNVLQLVSNSNPILTISSTEYFGTDPNFNLIPV